MSWSLRHKWSLWVRLCLVTPMFAGLVAGALTPGLTPSAEHGIDIGVHTAVYAFMTIMTVLIFERPLVSGIVIFTLSGAIELMQSFVPGRTGSLSDVAVNGVGIAVALGLIWLVVELGFPATGAKVVSEKANVRSKN